FRLDAIVEKYSFLAASNPFSIPPRVFARHLSEGAALVRICLCGGADPAQRRYREPDLSARQCRRVCTWLRGQPGRRYRPWQRYPAPLTDILSVGVRTFLQKMDVSFRVRKLRKRPPFHDDGFAHKLHAVFSQARAGLPDVVAFEQDGRLHPFPAFHVLAGIE